MTGLVERFTCDRWYWGEIILAALMFRRPVRNLYGGCSKKCCAGEDRRSDLQPDGEIGSGKPATV
jgi:hypothetical protein